MSKNEEAWLANYEALKAHVIETGHFPNKHDKRLNWYKYNVKLIKQGKLSEEREQMIHELENMRSGEHTGGRRKKEPNLNPLINEEITTNS
jgi:hypothetical protein